MKRKMLIKEKEIEEQFNVNSEAPEAGITQILPEVAEKAEEPEEKLNFVQRFALKRMIKKLNSKLEKHRASNIKEQGAFKEQQLKAIEEIINMTGLTYYGIECECKASNCEEKGKGHKKTECEVTFEQMKDYSCDELTVIFTEILEELRQKV